MNEDACPDLIASLVQRSYNEYAANSRWLIGSLTAELAEAKAELAAIRDTIDLLFLGPYAPSQAAILRALYPDRKLIESFTEGT
jgi:hypothetical protein